jgi:phage terminase Nu1 subunit (DNA packaging protein)
MKKKTKQKPKQKPKKARPPIRKPVRDSGRDARRRRDLALAGIRELELSAKRGEFVPIKAVMKERGELGRAIRDAVMSIPDRLSHVLAAENDPRKIARILRGAISESLTELCDRQGT